MINVTEIFYSSLANAKIAQYLSPLSTTKVSCSNARSLVTQFKKVFFFFENIIKLQPSYNESVFHIFE